MNNKKQIMIITLIVVIVSFIQCSKEFEKTGEDISVMKAYEVTKSAKDKSLIAEGKQTFRFDTFGDEDFWSGLLHLDKAIAGAKNGGFGAGVSPKTALAVGLKVDAEALPADVVAGIRSGKVDLVDPATTLTL